MMSFLKIVAFLCTLGILLLFRSGSVALLKEPDQDTSKVPAAEAPPSECVGDLLDFNAPKGSDIYMFRKEVQEALVADIKSVSALLKESLGLSEPLDPKRIRKVAVVVEAFTNVDARVFVEQWQAVEIFERSELVVLRRDEAVVKEFQKLGCGSSTARCLILEDASTIPWDSYDGVVLGAPLEPLPKNLPAEIPTAVRSVKSVSANAKGHAKWVAGKVGLYNEGLELELIGSLVVSPRSASKILSLRHHLVDWLEAYEFSKYEKSEAVDDDYWPWPRRVQIANMIIGNFIKSHLVDI